MFDGGQTENIIREKLLPVLEELARAEFGVYSTSGNVDHESAKWMKDSEQAMEELIQSYLQGLLNLHLSYGYQYEQAEERIEAREALMQAQSPSEQTQALRSQDVP